MKIHNSILKLIFVIGFVFLSVASVAAQKIVDADALFVSGNTRDIEFSFDKNIALVKIKRCTVLDLDSGGSSIFDGLPSATIFPSIYTITTTSAMTTTADPKTKLNKIGSYLLNCQIEDPKGNIAWQQKAIGLNQPLVQLNDVTKQKVKDIDDADVWIDGEMKGAFKKKATFSTNIKLQKLIKEGSWVYSPLFFKLNASTAPDADPDSMEFGTRFRYIFDKQPFYWDNEVKIESERDFENTNFIYSTRFTYVNAGYPRKKSEAKLFFRPFIGTEVGKNLRSPLQAAEGDGLARLLLGADARVWIRLDRETGRQINWTTSYIRRWLLTDELGFETDNNDVLQLVRFGKSPRDYIKSKAAYSFNKFFGAFVEYEWGQLPPSYKFVNHKFRLGFFYKFAFGVE